MFCMTNPIKDGKQCILSRVIVMYLCMANRAFLTVSPFRAGRPEHLAILDLVLLFYAFVLSAEE